jgi:tetratricopeptide (TPR) repeat protein
MQEKNPTMMAWPGNSHKELNVDYCKYHPLDGATYACRACNICQCDKCVDDEHNAAHCFVCGTVLESLGSANTVEPFWRRLKEAFKYPVNAASMSLIVITAIISVLATLMPFLLILSLVLYLFAAGSLMKYSFTCLERTAMGEMKAPDVMDAYQGGIKLLLQLVLMTIVLTVIVGLAYYYLGSALGGLLGFVAVFSYPAILIRFAQTENMLEAMKPFAAIALMAAIGLPYGLLIVFMLIMMTSVGVLHEWIGTLFPAVSYLLQSIISNYYTVVMFHLMGYMLFQYQEQLGYSARSDEDDDIPHRSEQERLAAKIEVMLKEGDYEQVVKLYYHAFKQYPNEPIFFEKFFDLLYVCKKAALMADYGLIYLEFLNRKKRFDKLTPTFKQILFVVPDYLPDSPAMRVQLATLLKQQGDLKLAVKLLNGMHKLYPEFAGLPDAYHLLADTLGEMPGMQAQADKCHQVVIQLKRKAEERQAALALQVEQKREADAHASNKTGGAKAIRKGPPPGTTLSGLTLELVPLEPVVAKADLGGTNA